ncbi:hypothetical protein [Litchfieldia alkalitelluris]|uniref:hypothetical protein n=1 Tax=Litchfieldia alkalitelluris TaxID=304268 RepID=UPI0009988929|nr:hypothetical protein [Litchfieldia alkalitelluris]
MTEINIQRTETACSCVNKAKYQVGKRVFLLVHKKLLLLIYLISIVLIATKQYLILHCQLMIFLKYAYKNKIAEIDWDNRALNFLSL